MHSSQWDSWGIQWDCVPPHLQGNRRAQSYWAVSRTLSFEPHWWLDSWWHRFSLKPWSTGQVFRVPKYCSTSVKALCPPVPSEGLFHALPVTCSASTEDDLPCSPSTGCALGQKAALGPCCYLIRAQPTVSELSKVPLVLLKQCWGDTEPPEHLKEAIGILLRKGTHTT